MLQDKKLGTNYKIADKWMIVFMKWSLRERMVLVFAIRQIGLKEGNLQVVHHNMIHPVRSINREEFSGGVTERRVLALAKVNTLMDILFSVLKKW